MISYCAFDRKCTVFDDSVGLAGLTHASICEGCRVRARSELNLLRFDYVDLSQLVPKNPRPSDVKIAHAKPESSPPLDMGVWTLREDIAWALRTAAWAVKLAVHDDDAPPFTRTREGYGVDRCIGYLSAHVDDLAQLPMLRAIWRVSDEMPAELDGIGVLTYLGLLHRSARKACGLDAGILRLPGDCPRCLASALRRSLDEPGKIWCGNCSLSLTAEQYLSAIRVTEMHMHR